MHIVLFLLIGALAGWIASRITKGRGLGFIGNMVLGIFGAVIGGVLFGLLGLQATGILGVLVVATVGAIVLIYIVNYFKKV
jgi:uncharacterized membrane protein YeaQ/YmgE (transglycosylase-associated protein family)